MQDLTSCSFNDHENGEESAQNYTGGSCQWSQDSWDQSPRKQLVTHYVVKDWNPAAPATSPCSRKHMSEVCKFSSLASTQLAVFGGGGMLPMTPITPSPPSNMEVETLCFGGGSAKGTGQLHRIKVTMDGTMYRQGQGIEASQGIENGLWMGIPAWQWPKTHRKKTNGWPLWLSTRVLPPSTKSYFAKGSNIYLTH